MNFTELLSNYYQLNIVKVILFFILIIIFDLMKKFVAEKTFKIISKYTAKTTTDLDDKIFESLKKPVEFLFMVIAISISTNMFEFNAKADFFVEKFTKTLIMYAIFWGIYKASDVIVDFIKRSLQKTNVNLKENNLLIPFFRKTYKVLVIVLATVMISNIWYNVGVLLTGLGIGGLAIALAAKDTAANLFGSIMLIISRPFEIGSYIETPDVTGIVENIGFRSTTIRKLDQSIVYIPNSLMNSVPITNFSEREKRRERFTIGFTYNSTKEQIKEFTRNIESFLKKDSRILTDDIFAIFTDFNDSSMDVLIQYHTDPISYAEFLSIKESINIEIMDLIEEIGLEMAFPSTSIYIEKEDIK